MVHAVKKVKQKEKKDKWYSWIPNTSGAISFHTVGRNKYPDPVVAFTQKIPAEIQWQDVRQVVQKFFKKKHLKDKRIVLSFAYQKRNNYDGYFPLPLFLSEKRYKKFQISLTRLLFRQETFEPEVSYFVFYCGSYLPSGKEKPGKLYEGVQSINGVVLALMPASMEQAQELCENIKQAKDPRPEDSIKNIKKAKELQLEYSIKGIKLLLNKSIGLLRDSINDSKKETGALAADFELERNGVISMSNFRYSSSVEDAINEKASITNIEHQELITDYANQLFYFIKDLFHEHTHHSSSDDNLSSLHPAPAGNFASRVTRRYKLGCLRQVLQKLRRRYVKMENNFAERHHLLGFLAYMGNLKTTIKQLVEKDKLVKKSDKNTHPLLVLNHESMRESAAAFIDREDKKSERGLTKRRWTYGLLTAFFIFALENENSSQLTAFLYYITLGEFHILFSVPIWIFIGCLFVYKPHETITKEMNLQNFTYWQRVNFSGGTRYLYWITSICLWVSIIFGLGLPAYFLLSYFWENVLLLF